MIQRIAMGFVLLFIAQQIFADEIRPGYLGIKENTESVFSVLWKVPAKGEKKLGLQVQLPDNCVNKTQANTQFINAAYIQRWITVCEGGLVNQSISIAGLNTTNTDVLLRLEFISGLTQSELLTPTKNAFTIPTKTSVFQIVSTYTAFGIEHILQGLDHLLFVFALLLIVNNTRKLIITITAFTIAHSITLGSATLSFVYVPQQPVEAVIALSILFLAVEIIHGQQGRVGYAARWPWLVAFIFGLLHGFGFAGALTEIGLPQHAIPLALIFFNVGVELGQLFFVLVVVIIMRFLHQLSFHRLVKRVEAVMVYSIGGFSSYWVFERVSLF